MFADLAQRTRGERTALSHLYAVSRCFEVIETASQVGVQAFGFGDPHRAAWDYLSRSGELDPLIRRDALVWEILSLARLCTSDRLALNFKWRWEVRTALIEAVRQLRADQEHEREAALVRTCLLEATIAEAQLEMDLGRMELAYECFEALLRDDPSLANSSEFRLARLQWDFADRQFEFVSPLPPPAPDAEALEHELQRVSVALSLQARLQLVLELALLDQVEAARARDAAEAVLQEAELFVATCATEDLHGLRLLHQMVSVALECKRMPEATRWFEQATQRLRARSASEGQKSIAHFEHDIIHARMADHGLVDGVEAQLLDVRIRERWKAMAGAWSRSPSPEGGIGFLFTWARREQYSQALHAARRNAGDGGGLDTLLETQLMGAVERRLDLQPPEQHAIGALLADHGAGVLAFVPGDRDLLICALDARGIRWFELAPLHRVRAASRALSDELERHSYGSGDSARIEMLAKQIGAQVWTSELVAWADAWQHIVVVGDEFLDGLPLEALCFGDHGPLGLHKPISFAPSIPFLMHLAQSVPATREGALEVLVSATGIEPRDADALGLSALPAVDWAEQGVHTTSSNLVELQGPSATLQALRSALTEEVELLTLLGHGVRDTTRLVPGGILIAGDPAPTEVLWCDQLRQLDAPATCVLLVCKAASGLSRIGDGGVAHPDGVLLEAGARSVLASPHELEMSTALAIHATWHSSWSRGASPSEALLEAKQALPTTLGPAPFRAQVLRVYGLGYAR